jgi:hypothetical protein
MFKRPALLLLGLLFSSYAHGEYRVYQYYVKAKVKNIGSPNAQVVTSTLDPISYTAYYGGREMIEVNLLRSWMCMGNTANKPFCTISDGKELVEGPVASATEIPVPKVEESIPRTPAAAGATE